MINITINRNESGLIQSFTMSGHALFAEPWIRILYVQVHLRYPLERLMLIHELTGITPEIEQGEEGFLNCRLPDHISKSVQENIQLLLEGMVISLQTIEEQYGEHIKITFKK